MPYFQEYYDQFKLKEDIVRKSQLGAYWATLAHYTKSNEPSLISLPTGSGKTELMQLLSFGLKGKRILIVIPSLLLKGEIYERFKEFKVLREGGIIPSTVPKPKVKNLGKKCKTEEDWNAFEGYDVVIATPNTVSSFYENVIQPPQDLFDIVFIDEAHHVEADTWNQIVSDFQGSKKVFLTATPFRNDHQKIKGELIYHYPIKKAIEDGIYQKIEYIPIIDATHKKIALKTKEIAEALRTNGEIPKILARSKNVKESSEIINEYTSLGLNLKEINYQKSKKYNEQVILELKANQIDGIVCVGMVGEGINIPDLNILSFHSLPKSFPLTIQFIGRVSRINGGVEPKSFIVAEENEFKSLFRLVHQNEDGWDSLIDNIEDAIGYRMSRVFDSKFFDKRLYKDFIKPFYSVTLYDCLESFIQFSEDIKIGDNKSNSNLKIEYIKHEAAENLLIVITLHEESPQWATETPIIEKRYNLHLFYFDTLSNILFEGTTLPWISKLLLKEILNEEVTRVSHKKLANVINKTKLNDYVTLGMKNALGQSRKNPSYKSHIGNSVHNSISKTDENFFTAGHALTRDMSEKYLGVSTAKGRVWSLERGKIDDFLLWCKERALDIAQNQNQIGFPMLEKLIFPQEISVLEERPLVIYLDENIYNKYFEIRSEQGEKYMIKSPAFIIDDFDNNLGKLTLHLELTETETIDDINYSITDGWEIDGDFTVQYGLRTLPLKEFLNMYPPRIYLKNGLVIRNSYYEIESSQEITNFLEIYKRLSWDGCQIRFETRKKRSKEDLKWRKPIHDWMIDYLSFKLNSESLIIQDDGSNEIADIISFDANKKEICLYHCKGGGGNDVVPGARLGDFEVVCSQAIRSTIWINNKNLILEIRDRLESNKRKSTEIKMGNRVLLDSIIENFGVAEWMYKIIIVQPWGEREALWGRDSLQRLFTTTYQWINASEADFEIWGS